MSMRIARHLPVVAVVLVTAVAVGGLVLVLAPVTIGEPLSLRGQLVASVGSSAALMISGFALLISLRTQEAGFRAEERVKEDLAVLLTLLSAISRRLLLPPLLTQIGSNEPHVIVAEQRKKLGAILNSTTGFALDTWAARKSAADTPDSADGLQFPIYVL